MEKWKLFTNYIMLATSPALLAYPEHHLPQVSFQVRNERFQQPLPTPETVHWLGDWWWGSQQQEEWVLPITYDEIIQMLGDLESGELERRYSPTQLEKINDYIVLLAKEGILPNEFQEECELEGDTYDLMYGEDSGFQLTRYLENSQEYMIVPAILNGYSGYDVIQCGKISKAWKKTKKFCKKHKKEIIIGAVIVVAVTAVAVAIVVTSTASAASAAAGAAGAAGAAASGSGSGSSSSSKSESTGSSSSAPSVSQSQPSSNDIPIFKSAMDEQISSFKENIAHENFFQPTTTGQGLSLEETGRAIGPLFAHESFNHFNNQLSSYPQFSQEVQSIASQYNFAMPPGASDNPLGFGHNEIDKRFASDYGPIFSNPAQEVDFNTLSYQARGEAASFYGYHNEAIHDFSKAIEMNPRDPTLYLQRGISHLNAEQYESSIADFRSYAAQSEPISQKEQFNLGEFTVGFIEGLPQGVCKGGKDILLFAYDGITHPIHTAKELYNACSVLATYVQTNEWEAVGKTLSPELHKVITEWGYIPSRELGNLISSSIGEFGSQALVPMAGGKLIVKGIKGAQEVTYVLKTIGRAEEMILLEAAAEAGNSAKFGEILNAGRNTLFLGEELGFTAKEIGHLKQAGKLETALTDAYGHLSLSMQESVSLFKEAQIALKPHAKKNLPELRARELIHETGIPTFPRPKGIPENYVVMISDKGAGMKYVHPKDTGTYVRIMPGKPHSPFPYQQKPYVNQRVHGQSLDKHGNIVLNDSLEAHIPIKEFIYKDIK